MDIIIITIITNIMMIIIAIIILLILSLIYLIFNLHCDINYFNVQNKIHYFITNNYLSQINYSYNFIIIITNIINIIIIISFTLKKNKILKQIILLNFYICVNK